MPDIGNYEYPSMGLRTILDSISKIAEARITSVSGVAQILGHKSENSGAFLTKLAAMSKYYKVIDRRGENIELTSLGKRIAHPDTPEERDDAIAEMVLGVPLFKELYDRLGGVYEQAQFPIYLREITSAERDAVAAESSKIQNLYDEALPYLRKKGTVSQTNKSSKEMSTLSPASTMAIETPSSIHEGMIRLEIFGKPPIIVPDKEHYIESLIKDLQDHKSEVKKKPEPDA